MEPAGVAELLGEVKVIEGARHGVARVRGLGVGEATLTVAGQRVILSLNKQDNYLPADREVVVTQVQQRLEQLSLPIACRAIATAPKPI